MIRINYLFRYVNGVRLWVARAFLSQVIIYIDYIAHLLW